MYHLQFSLQAANPETFRYILVLFRYFLLEIEEIHDNLS
jgi:hypothetical protein